jgi:hypothetical protein
VVGAFECTSLRPNPFWCDDASGEPYEACQARGSDPSNPTYTEAWCCP